LIVEDFALEPGHHMRGHGHACLHVCLLRGGSFAERLPDGSWRECEAGSIRVSPAHTLHELVVSPEGARGQIVELTERLAAGLSRHPNGSVFAGAESVGAAWTRLAHPRSPFEAEAASLELVARAITRSSGAAPPAWLEDLRIEHGRSIGDHVRAQRVARGELLLRMTDQPITEIAADLGFVDQAHFTRAFRARYGSPPARYRRAQRS